MKMDLRFFGKAAVGLPVVLCALSSIAADVRFAGTGTLQAALDAGAGGKVTIAKGVWKVDPAFIRDRTEIVFEDGAELEANPEGFFGIADCVLTASNVTDIVVRGGTIRMHRQDYLDKKDGRLRSQWRHGLSLRGARNVLVEDMRFYECGGDGIYITSTPGGEPSRNVTVRNTLLSRGLRQGMSVIDVEGLLLENCVFERTLGENPQAGIDFEPNSPSQRLKGVVMRGCRFSENVRKGINLHLDSLKGPSEPVDFLIENCVCVSNAIGFGLCFNSKAQSFVKGRVIVSNCLFSTSWEQGIDVTQKPLSGLQLEFHDVTVEKSCLKDPSLEEIHFEDKFVWDEPVDGVLFDRVTVRPTKGIPWFRYARHSRRKIPVRAIRGNVTVVEADGTEKTVTVTPEGIERDFPHADGAEIVPFAAPDWTAFVPPAVDGWQDFEPLELRGHLNFLFYADRARTVRFTGGLRECVQPTDRAGPLLFYSIDKPRRKLVEVPPNDDRFGSFSFDAPKAGWYILYHTPGRNGFYLTGCDAPIIFMDAERRWFKPDGTCFRLPPGKAVWGLKPLGTKGTLDLPTVFPRKPDLATGPRVWPTEVFRDGTVHGVIVSEGEDTRKLAEELKWHFDQMSGTETKIVTSVPSDVPSVVLRRGGARGESRIRREGRALVLEGEGYGLSHAVTYLLEAMGCRYLWPGRLGKVIPRMKEIRLPVIEFSFKPTFRSRNIRQPSFAAANGELEKKLGFTHAETSAYDRLRAQAEIDRPGNRDFFAWHGVAKEDDNEGQREWGHAFGDYYQKYGKTHPDWFALQENGSRKLNLAKHPSRPAFCLSNGEFVEHAAADVIDGFRRHPDSSVRSACLPDGGDAQVCLCPSCRAMDPVDGRPIELWIRRREWRGYEPYVSLTDRTLSFYNAIAARVAEACPGKRVSGYAYSHYTEPPRSVRPHPSLVLLSVAGDYETQAGRDAVERNLAGWLSFGNEILWRPNTLIGFRMAAPQCVGSLQFEDLEKAKANGVAGADVCASSSQWACRPFDVYFSAKGLLNPDRLGFSALADDFCRSGFGPAAREMRDYLDALVEMGDRAATESQDPITTTTGPSVMKGYVKAFDLDRLEKILDRAVKAAKGDEVALKRLSFLRIGIESGRLTAAVGRARMDGGDVRTAQRAFVDFLRRTMMREPLAVAPYWSASNFYEPHMRGYAAGGPR